ncbi:MAG TPA: ABC transporter ATP-binding protein [Clostridia bacterium]|nr:ABC transporter ATP-binding protein [Clostridia bacterium]
MAHDEKVIKYGGQRTGDKGSVFGFLGLNGAGKTTTIRMITGLAKPTGGTISVCGEKVRFGSSAANRHIGYLPDVPEFYGFLKPAEYLNLCGRLSGMEHGRVRPKAAELLNLVGLQTANRRIGGFSRGMKQRLGIAQALIHEPELLILDEPTSALDPVGRKEILEIIASLRGRVTVLFSTHILSDAQRVCDNIGILHRGKLALSGSLSEIEQKFAGQSIRIGIHEPNRISELRQRLAELAYVKEIKDDGPSGLLLHCGDTDLLGQTICPILSELGLSLLHFEQVESNLEDVFIEVIGNE